MSTELTLGTTPAYLSEYSTKSIVADAVGGTFIAPNTLSLKGKMFTLIKTSGDDAGTKEIEDATLDVIILNANPNNSKVYFEGTYNGEDGIKPRCSSVDGKKPDTHIQEPISKSCFNCPNNQVGSGKEGRGKACADMKHIAVLPSADPTTPYLLTLKVTSIISLRNYIGQLAKHKVGAEFVVTQLSFKKRDTKGNIISYPSLDFKALGYVPKERISQIQALQQTEEVLKMIKALQDTHVEEEYEEDIPFTAHEVPFGAVDLPPAKPVELKKSPARKPAGEVVSEYKTSITVEADPAIKKKAEDISMDEIEIAKRELQKVFGGDDFAL